MRGRKWLRRLVALAVGLMLALVLAESALRWVLFSDSELAQSLGERVRVPEAFGGADANEAFWYLQRRHAPSGRIAPAPGPDPELGWNGKVIDPATMRHFEADRVGARRPVLLYGDSFAQGVVAREHLFQGLLDASPLASRFVLLNHGVGGFGIDQAWMMFDRTIEVWRDKRPVVVFAILLGADIERAGLGFRGWPKPRLEPTEDGLVAHPPPTLDPDAWFEQEFSTWRPWLARLALHRSGLLPETLRQRLLTWSSSIDEKRAITDGVIAALGARCRSIGVEPVVLLCCTPGDLSRAPTLAWQEPYLRAACARHGVGFLDTRAGFAALAARAGDPIESYYLGEGNMAGHWNEAGNRVVFEAITDVIEGRTGDEWIERVVRLRDSGAIDPYAARSLQLEILGRTARLRARPLLGCARAGRGLAPWLGAEDEYVLALRASEHGAEQRSAPTRIAFELRDGSTRFLARARRGAYPDDGCDFEPVLLRAFVDGREVGRFELAAGASEVALDLDLRGGSELELEVEKPSGAPRCGFAVLVEPRFE